MSQNRELSEKKQSIILTTANTSQSIPTKTNQSFMLVNTSESSNASHAMMSPPTDISTQVIAVKETQEVRYTEWQHQQHQFSSKSDVSIQASQTEYHYQASAQAHPLKPEGEGKFETYYIRRILHPITILEKILNLTAHQETCHQIIQKDIINVIAYRNYQDYLSTYDRQDFDFFVFSILANLAEHGFELPEKAIVILLEEIQLLESDNHNLALYALSHLIHHGQALKTKLEIIDTSINHLIKKNKAEYRETIIIALSAKTKLSGALRAEEISILKSAFRCLYKEDNEMHQRSEKKSSANAGQAQKSHLDSVRWFFTPSIHKSLKKIESEIEAGNLLPSYYLNYAVSRYTELDISVNKRVYFNLIRKLIKSRQRDFKEKELLKEALLSGLREPYPEIKQWTIFISHELIINQEIMASDLKKELDQALIKEQIYALKSISQYLNQHGLALFKDKEGWITILEEYEKKYHLSLQNKDIKDLICYLKSKLKENLSELSQIMLSKEHCHEVLNTVLLCAKQGERISSEIVEQLEHLVMKPFFLKTQDSINSDHKIQALTVLECIVENKQILTERMIAYLISDASIESSPIINLSLKILGYSVLHHKDYIFGKIKIHFMDVFKNTLSAEIIQDAIFLIAKLVETMQDIKKEWTTFSKLEKEIIDLFSEKHDRKNDEAILSLLEMLVDRNFYLERKSLSYLYQVFYLFKEKESYRVKLLKIIGKSLESYQKMGGEKLISEPLFYAAMSECIISENPLEIDDAAYVISKYLRLIDDCPTEQFIKLISLSLKNQGNRLILGEILKVMSLKRWRIPEQSLLDFLDDQASLTIEEKFLVLNQIQCVSKNQTLSEAIFKKLFYYFPIYDEGQNEILIEIFKNQMIQEKKISKQLVLLYHTKWVNVIQNQVFDFDLRMQVVKILEWFSKQDCPFHVEFFDDILSFFSEPDSDFRNILLEMIKNQCLQFKKNELFRYPSFKKIIKIAIENALDKSIRACCISLLLEAKKYGYVLLHDLCSACDFNQHESKVWLGALSDLLYRERRSQVRLDLLTLIECVPVADRPKTVQVVYEFENWVRLFFLSQLSEKKQIFNYLLKRCQSNQCPTKGVFCVLESVFLEKQKELIPFAFDICQQIQKNRALPKFLMPAIIQLTASKELDSFSDDFCFILANQVIQTKVIQFEIFQCLESWICKTTQFQSQQGKILKVVIEALLIALNCEYPIHGETVFNLLNWIQDVDIEISISVMQLINAGLKISSSISTLAVSNIISYLNNKKFIENGSAFKLLKETILNLSSNGLLNSENYNQVFMISSQNFKLQDPDWILEFTKIHEVSNSLSDESKEVIRYKISEKIFLTDQCDINTKLDLFEKVISRDAKRISGQSWVVIKNLFKLDLDFSKRNQLEIQFFQMMNQIRIPESFILDLLDFIDEACGAVRIFQKIRDTHLQLSQTVLEALLKKLRISKNELVRGLIRDILKLQNKNLSESILSQMESDNLKDSNHLTLLEKVKRIEKSAKLIGGISKEQVDILISTLDSISEAQDLSVAILCHHPVVDGDESLILKTIIDRYLDQKESLSQEKIMAVIKSTLKRNQFHASELTSIKIFIESKLDSNLGIREFKIDQFILLWNVCKVYDDHRPSQEALYLNLMRFFNQIDHHGQLTLLNWVIESLTFISSDFEEKLIQFLPTLKECLLENPITQSLETVPSRSALLKGMAERDRKICSLLCILNLRKPHLLNALLSRKVLRLLIHKIINLDLIKNLKWDSIRNLNRNQSLQFMLTLIEFNFSMQLEVSVLTEQHCSSLIKQMMLSTLFNQLEKSNRKNESSESEFGKIKEWFSIYSDSKDAEIMMRDVLMMSSQEYIDLSELENRIRLHSDLLSESISFQSLSFRDLKFSWICYLIKMTFGRNLIESQIIDIYESLDCLSWTIDEIESASFKISKNDELFSNEELVSFFKFLDFYQISSEWILSENSISSLEDFKRKLILMVLKIKIVEIFDFYQPNKDNDIQSAAMVDQVVEFYEENKNLENWFLFFDRYLFFQNSMSLIDLVDTVEMTCRYKEFIYIEDILELQTKFNPYEFSKFSDLIHFTLRERLFKSKNNPRELLGIVNEFKAKDFKQNLLPMDSLIHQLDPISFHEKVLKAYLGPSTLFKFRSKTIDSFSESDIKEWVSSFKIWSISDMDGQNYLLLFQKFPEKLIECFSVLIRASKLAFKYEPYHTQLFALLLLILGKSPSRGVFLQISTGEGKSLIIAMLAVIKSLFSKNVDIITSASSLAIRDAGIFSSFYRLFNITVDHNIDRSYKSGVKKCYAANVIYGDMSHFQYDYLRDRYSQLNTLGNRVYQAVIIDEVDHPLVDEGNKIAMLSSVLPGMDELHDFLFLIWHYLLNLENLVRNPDLRNENCENPYFKIVNGSDDALIKKNKIVEVTKYLMASYVDVVLLNSYRIELYKQINIEDQSIALNTVYLYYHQNQIEYALMDSCGKIHRQPILIENHADFMEVKNILLGTNPSRELTQKENDILSKCMLEFGFRLCDADQFTVWPKCLDSFVLIQKKKWIESAISAFFLYKENVDYYIKKNERGVESIFLVDYLNTGEILTGMTWGDGLHQFLQMKHGLKVCSENIITNYLTNVSFVKKYQKPKTKENDLTGITGTIGSDQTQSLLSRVYNGIDFYHLPTYFPNQRRKMPTYIALDENAWVAFMVKSAVLEAKQGRVVLMLCETIEEANQMKIALSMDDSFKGILYEYSDNLSHSNQFLERELIGNTIIISTNLSGRGTDIKLHPEVIKKGGLHLCMGFLAPNMRVENQAFGRAGRRGEPGTVQVILNQKKLKEKFPNLTIENLNELSRKPELLNDLRDQIENIKLDQLEKNEFRINQLKDQLFESFLQLRSDLLEFEKTQEDRRNLYFKKQEKIQVGLVDQAIKTFDFRANRVVQEFRFQKLKKYKMASIEERWGFWLKSINFNEAESIIWQKFQALISQLKLEYISDQVIQNPIYYTRLGHELLNASNSLYYKMYSSDFCKVAIEYYDLAIHLDLNFSDHARYHKVYALARLGDPNLKQQSLSILKAVSDRLKKRLIRDQMILSALSCQTKPVERDFDFYQSRAHYTQLCHRFQVNELFLNAVNVSMTQVWRSLKPIDLVLHDRDRNIQVLSLLKEEAIQKITKHQGAVSLTFHHLTTHSDITYQSQLMNTIFGIQDSGNNIKIEMDTTTVDKSLGREAALFKLLPKNWNQTSKADLESSSSTVQESRVENEKEKESEVKEEELFKSLPKNWNQTSEADLESSSSTVQESRVESEKKKESEIKEEVKEKSRESEKTSKERNLYGVLDYANKGTEVTFQVISKATLFLAKKIKQASDKKDWLLREIDNLKYDYHQLSNILVWIEITYADIKHLLKDIEEPHYQVGTDYDLWIQSPSQSLLAFFLNEEDKKPPEIKNYLKIKVQSTLESSVQEMYLFKYKSEYVNKHDHQIISIFCREKSINQINVLLNTLSCACSDRKDMLDQSTLIFSMNKVNQVQVEQFIQVFPSDFKLVFKCLTSKESLALLSLHYELHNQIQFSLEYLEKSKAIQLVQQADRVQQDLVPQHQSITEAFLKINSDPLFPIDFIRNAYWYLYQLDEKSPMPWRSLILMSSLMVLEISGGIALAALSGGTAFGAGFAIASEGVSDLMRLFKMMQSRQFSVGQTFFQKGLSLSLGLGMVGVSHAFSAGQNASSVVQAVDNALEYGEVAVNAALLTSGVRVGAKEVMFEMAKRTGLATVESAGANTIEYAIEKTTNFILSGVQLDLNRDLKERVKHLFLDPRWKSIFNQIFAADECIEKNIGSVYQDLIFEQASTIIESLSFSIPGLDLSDEKGLASFKHKFYLALLNQEKEIHSFEDILKYALKRKDPSLSENQIDAIVKSIIQCLKSNSILTEFGIHPENLKNQLIVKAGDEMEETIQMMSQDFVNEDSIKNIQWSEEISGYKIFSIKKCIVYAECLQTQQNHLYEQWILRLLPLFFDRAQQNVSRVASAAKYFANKIGASAVTGIVKKVDTWISPKPEAKTSILSQESKSEKAAENTETATSVKASETTEADTDKTSLQQPQQPQQLIGKKRGRGFFGFRKGLKKAVQAAAQEQAEEGQSAQSASTASSALQTLSEEAVTQANLDKEKIAEAAAKAMQERIQFKKLDLVNQKDGGGLIGKLTPAGQRPPNMPAAQDPRVMPHLNANINAQGRYRREEVIPNKIKNPAVLIVDHHEHPEILNRLFKKPEGILRQVISECFDQVSEVLKKQILEASSQARRAIKKEFDSEYKKIKQSEKSALKKQKSLLKFRLALLMLNGISFEQAENLASGSSQQVKKIDWQTQVWIPANNLARDCFKLISSDSQLPLAEVQYRFVLGKLEFISKNKTRFYRELKDLKVFFIRIGEIEMALSRPDQNILDQQAQLNQQGLAALNINSSDSEAELKKFWAVQSANLIGSGLQSGSKIINDRMENAQYAELLRGGQMGERSFVSLKVLGMISNSVLAVCESNKAMIHEISEATKAIQMHQSKLVESLIALEKEQVKILNEVKASIERASADIVEKVLQLNLERVDEIKELMAEYKKTENEIEELFKKAEQAGQEDLTLMQKKRLEIYQNKLNDRRNRVSEIESTTPERIKIIGESLHKLNEQNTALKKHFIDAWAEQNQRLTQFIQTAHESSSAIIMRCIDVSEKMADANMGMFKQYLNYYEKKNFNSYKANKEALQLSKTPHVEEVKDANKAILPPAPTSTSGSNPGASSTQPSQAGIYSNPATHSTVQNTPTPAVSTPSPTPGMN